MNPRCHQPNDRILLDFSLMIEDVSMRQLFMWNVLIASTNQAVVDSLQSHLRSHEFHVATVNTAESVMMEMQGYPSVTVIGEEINCQPGFRVSEWFRGIGGRSAVMVIGDTEAQSVVDALDAGADDFVTNETDVREMLCRIRALLRRFS